MFDIKKWFEDPTMIMRPYIEFFIRQQFDLCQASPFIYRSAKYKPLFGETADSSLQARFRVVKVKGTTLTDTEIKNRVLSAIDEFFDIDNWEFGETFFFTELSAYVHNQLLGIIGSIVIVPVQEDSSFGNLFQVTPNSDEIFIPDISLNSIDIVTSYTSANLRQQ